MIIVKFVWGRQFAACLMMLCVLKLKVFGIKYESGKCN